MTNENRGQATWRSGNVAFFARARKAVLPHVKSARFARSIDGCGETSVLSILRRTTRLNLLETTEHFEAGATTKPKNIWPD
jgi:hypothetical protein